MATKAVIRLTLKYFFFTLFVCLFHLTFSFHLMFCSVVSHCDGMTMLPNFVEHGVCLESIWISCSSLVSLPDTLDRLIALTTLDIISNAITTLPDSLCRLPALRNLFIWCEALTSLPESIGHLTTLLSMELSECNALTMLPVSMGELVLTELEIQDCSRLTSLPVSCRAMTFLSNLVIARCKRLEELPDLAPSLSFLRIENCDALRRLPLSLAYMADDAVVSIRNVPNMIFPVVSGGPENSAQSIRKFMLVHHKPMKYLCMLLYAQHVHVQHLPDEIWITFFEM